jgi:hypothetical protein
MSRFRLALLLAVSLPVVPALFAQSSSSTSSSTSQDQTPAPATQSAPQQQSPTSVQGRIRARREKRRADAIREVYSHLYEVYAGMGQLRFQPGPDLQRVFMYSWDAGVTRYYSERLGVTLDGRGNYGTPYVGLNQYSITKPAISVYSAMAGPTYRFYLQPRYSISGRVLAGFMQGNFSGDTSGIGGQLLGLWGDGSTFGASASIVAEYNLSPNVGVRIAPEYLASGFGSTLQSGWGWTGGIVYRFGKQ